MSFFSQDNRYKYKQQMNNRYIKVYNLYNSYKIYI